MDKVKAWRVWRLAVIAIAVLAGCRGDHGRPSPLAVSDYRLQAIEQQVAGVKLPDVDSEMLAVDAEAYDRPAGAAFRDAVTRFYNATHPSCLVWSSDGTAQERDFASAIKAPLGDFDALVAQLELTPLRRDLDLAWHRAALYDKKAAAYLDCAVNERIQRELMRNSTTQMRDALDRMEAAMNAADG